MFILDPHTSLYMYIGLKIIQNMKKSEIGNTSWHFRQRILNLHTMRLQENNGI
jgi:hypothetical protein